MSTIKERPNFGPKQVRDFCEIKAGKKYREHTPSGTAIVTILAGAARFGLINVKKTVGETSYTQDMSLADCGVIPYYNCEWNETNWLEKIEDIDDTIISLENLEKRHDRILDNLVTLRFEINDAQDHLTGLLTRLKSE